MTYLRDVKMNDGPFDNNFKKSIHYFKYYKNCLYDNSTL